ncbi:hypothetical protein RCT80_00130 [Escherichia ruysiae]|nr:MULTISPECIES: hypothetical protein [Escherichia]MEC9875991.1 hypothetical protein [Escherichia ruysiae]MEC9885599.1 hypothetical protein [Escherichia ruysiae]MED9038573.1 hypothetical protein [Escherichia ruysiae]
MGYHISISLALHEYLSPK